MPCPRHQQQHRKRGCRQSRSSLSKLVLVPALVEWVRVEWVRVLGPACKQISAGRKQDRAMCQGGLQMPCPRHQQQHRKRVHKRCIAMFLQEQVQVQVWVRVLV
jgi:hypothetical protein